MCAYRLLVHRHGRLLGHFESAIPAALKAMRDIAVRACLWTEGYGLCSGWQLMASGIAGTQSGGRERARRGGGDGRR